MITASAAYDRDPSLVTKTYPVEHSLTLPQTNGQMLNNFGGESCGGQLPANFTVSCNTAFANMGLDLGAGNLAAQAKAFGFDQTPPIDLPSAAQAYFPPASSFAQDLPGLAKSAIGQENVASTPLEMALVAAGLANNGTIMVPHVLDHVTNSQNQVVSTYKPKPWIQATSAQTSAADDEAHAVGREQPQRHRHGGGHPRRPGRRQDRYRPDGPGHHRRVVRLVRSRQRTQDRRRGPGREPTVGRPVPGRDHRRADRQGLMQADLSATPSTSTPRL